MDFERNVARVYQKDILLTQSTVIDNLKITNAKEREIIEALKTFDFENEGDKLCSNLSGGQKRLTQFLRVLLSNKLICAHK